MSIRLNDGHSETLHVLVGTMADSVPSLEISVNPSGASIKEVASLPSSNGPTWVEIHPQDSSLVIIGLRSPGSLATYKILPPYDSWQHVSTALCGNWGRMCYGSWSLDARTVFAADYGAGGVMSFPVDAQGNITPRSSSELSYVDTPSPARSNHVHRAQGESHPHQIIPLPNTNFVYVPDLGLDLIHVHKLEDHKLVLVESVAAPHGSGPRHIAFHPSGEVLFLIGEWGCNVMTYKIDQNTGSLTMINESVSVLPPGVKQDKHWQAGEIAISSDGRHVYASNRYDEGLWVKPEEHGSEEDPQKPSEDSIAIFSVSTEYPYTLGKPTFAGTAGYVIRGMALDPTDRFLLAANQLNRTVTLFGRDATTGGLTKLATHELAGKQAPVDFAWMR